MWRRDRFSTINTRWRECARGPAQSARVPGSDGATGRATSVPWLSGHTDPCTHVGAGAGRRGRFFRPPRSGGGSVPVAAHSLRECRGAMARRGGPLPYLGYPVTPDACTHVGAGRWARPIFRPPRNGGGSVPVAAHSLRECRKATARRGGQRPFPLVWFPVGVAHEHFTVGQLVAGGSTRDVPTLTG